MIRHARGGRLLAKPIIPLPITMIESSLLAALVPPICASPLVAAGLLAALRTAIAMPAITMRADEEDRMAMLTAARPLQENSFTMGRHRRPAGVDNGSPAMSG